MGRGAGNGYKISSVASVVFAALCATMTALPAWSDGLPSSRETGQIEGQIVLYPAFPLARAGESNVRGVPGEVAVVDATGAVVKRVASDPSGRFAVDLPPGRYLLRLTSLRRPAASAPQAVTVASGRVTRAVLVLDAGIR
jgi:hypothetical protein